MCKTILVFDSGVGALSILQEMQTLLPNECYCFLFDNARLPYGDLPAEELIQGCVDLITKIVEKYHIDLIVIACNTASTLVLPVLRQILNIPIIGVVPAIKPAALQSKNKQIGLLATPGTIKRDYTHNLIQQFAKDCALTLVGSSELVLMVEDKMIGKPIDQIRLNQILMPFVQNSIDTLILGCTHFPIIKSELTHCLGDNVVLLDSGLAVAKRAQTLLDQQSTQETKTKNRTLDAKESIAFYTSKELHPNLTSVLKTFKFNTINQLY